MANANLRFPFLVEFVICFILYANIILQCTGLTRLDLTDKTWTIGEKSSGMSVQAQMPCSQYTALLNKGLIGDPLYRDNDVKLSWIGRTNWTFSTDFTVTSYQMSNNRAVLVCEGLDTIASVWINDKLILKANNMFVRWSYADVLHILKKGNNNIRIDFTSAVVAASASANQSSYRIPPECPPAVQHGECHVNQIRKEQCSFSWDWGPSFPTQGIWQPIYIDFFQTAFLDEISAVVFKENGEWQVTVEAYFQAGSGPGVKGRLEAAILGLNVNLTDTITVSSSENTYKFTLVIPKTTTVPLWWPNGYGDQPLFNLSVTFTAGSDVSARSVRIGFRTVELVQQPVANKGDFRYYLKADWRTYKGLTFYFKVNGIPIFLKGSNWIPADNFQERVTKEQLRYLLSSAANVSINAMRVWGGGIYESEELYDICDELGIMVWQDLMFSVALYPANPHFLRSVSDEVTGQVRRLKHRASIIVWAGNNENEKALRQDWFNVRENYTRYYQDYLRLYVTTIKPILSAEDPSRSYLTSSPTDGAESVKEGYIAKDPGSELYGDIHYYDYVADQWDASVFRIPRMASEYGIQSWCSPDSLTKVFQPSDFDIHSKMVDHRQHHAMGNLEMIAEVGLHLQLPNVSHPQDFFEEFVYLTQINQAMSMRTQTEHYRRHQSRVLPDGRGMTMGALYWQLNDIWQAPTWASIEYEGRWKMLHYYARHFFSKHLISPYILDHNMLNVYIVVDEIPVVETRKPGSGALTMQPMTTSSQVLSSEFPTKDMYSILHNVQVVTSGFLKINMHTYDKFGPIFSWTVPYQLKTTAESVLTKPVKDLMSESGCKGPEHCMLHFVATDHAGTTLSTSWVMFTYPKYAVLKRANIQVNHVTEINQSEYNVELSSDAPALFVWLSAGDIVGHFSDNGFHMLAQTSTVRFHSKQPTTVDRLRDQLAVRYVKNYSVHHLYNNACSVEYGILLFVLVALTIIVL